MTISQATKFLEDAFDALNREYFESALSRPIITIQTSPRAYGHFTSSEVWRDDKRKQAYHEINIAAESLDRPIANTIATLVHEMVHYYCQVNNIQDTSRGGTYHNKRFKEEGKKRGLSIDYDQRIGWGVAQPAKTLRSFCTSQHWRNKLTIARSGGMGGKDPAPRKPSSTRKYTCPRCGLSIRATREVNIVCGDCHVRLVTPSSEEKAS